MRALVLAVLAVTAAAAQPVDTLAVAPADTSVSRSPRAAVTRSLLLPGLGQLYNREPVKAPVAAALVAGAVVYAVNRQRQYLRFRRATVYALCQEDPGTEITDGMVVVTSPDRLRLCTEVAPGYQDEWQAVGSPAFSAVRPTRERARGQRDIGFLVVGLAYAFQAVDAYVAAELATFDVSEDVALRLGPEPASLGLRVRL